MKKEIYHNRTKVFLFVSFLLCWGGTVGIQAQTSEGRVYLKGGEQMLFADSDRVEIPRKKKDVQVYRNFFSRQCKEDVIPMDRVDSVVVWNTAARQNVHVLVPLEGVGWSWLYIDHPRMQVYVYASGGYSPNSMGGFSAFQNNTIAAIFLIPSKTVCDFYVKQPNGKLVCLGGVYKGCNKAFVHALCRSAELTEDQEKGLLMVGERNRSSMIQRVVGILDE